MKKNMNRLKNLKTFENFRPDVKTDDEILSRIKEISQEDWWINGEDAPEDIIGEFSEVEKTVNPDLGELIELTIGGPGLTDVWLSKNELISDVLDDENPPVSREEIDMDNKEWFAEKREELLAKLM
jgi:hypothetical protein